MKLESADSPPDIPASDLGDLMLAVINTQAQGVVVLDRSNNVLIWNSWMNNWTGIASAQAVGKGFETLVPAIIGDEFSSIVKDAIDAEKSTTWSLALDPERLDRIEGVMTRGDSLLPLSRVNATPLTVGGVNACLLEFVEAPFNSACLRGTSTQASKQNEPALPETDHHHFPVYLSSSETCLLSLDSAGIIQNVSTPLLIQTGYARHQLVGTSVRMLFPTLSENFDIENYQALIDARIKNSPEGVIEAATSSGEQRAFKITIYPSAVSESNLVLACHNFIPQSTTEDTIKRQREILTTVFNQVGDGIILLDSDGFIEQINPVGLAMLGLHAGQGYEAPVESVIVMVDDQGNSIDPCREALSRGSVYSTPNNTLLQIEWREPISISATATPIRDRNNQISGCVLVFRTVEESRRMSSRLSWQSDHDSLTQLPNRRFLENKLLKAIDSARSSNQVHALLYIDLHNFSLVNDTAGRAGGDTLLLECGKLLQRVVGTDHLVARIGNDEFAVLLHNCPIEEVREITEDILGTIKAFSFPWEERRLKIGLNIGVETINRDTSSEIDVLVTAASSCAAAKANGRNRVFYRQQRDDGLLTRRIGEWIPKINEALEEDRFCLYYQPIVPIGDRTKNYHRFEALVRMIDESGQIVAPGKFIPAAELYGLIDDIDRWVVKRVITELTSKKLRKKQDLRISVNLSGATIGDELFKDYVLGLIDESNIDPRQLQFEITETAAVRQFDRALDLIHALKAKGCYFSLDDFGSGLSSFGYLKGLPVDYLKIDGSFVRNIELNDIDYSMVSTINHLAKIMGIATVAECVENQAQLTLLEQIGLDYVQGFFLATPQPLEKFFP